MKKPDSTDTTFSQAVHDACARIAPVWPLDQSIAVNPWWFMTNQPVRDVSARIAAHGGARMVMTRDYFKQQWECGRIDAKLLVQACNEMNVKISVVDLLDHLEQEQTLYRMPLVAHVLDANRDLYHHIAWETEVTHQISQFCAAYFDRDQASWHLDTSKPPYAAWLGTVAHERGIGLLTGVKGLNQLFRSLPENPELLIGKAMSVLGVPLAHAADYLHALLLSINGWASWCAYRKWQAELQGETDGTLRELLAIRLAWELVLYEGGDVKDIKRLWKNNIATWPRLVPLNRKAQTYDWVWQRALELAYQQAVSKQLVAEHEAPSEAPEVQAAFCIDVRSEVFRRNFERISDRVQTIGFAGFFGVPAAYRPLGTTLVKQQLPGLLAPGILIEETCPHHEKALSRHRQSRLLKKDLWRSFRYAGTSGFSYVESLGLLYGWKLFKEGILNKHHAHAPGLSTEQSRKLKPRITTNLASGNEATVEEKAAMALRILKGMSLTENLAPLVLLVGHGSASNNNPLSGGLDCGACCGQSGEVNARAVAAMLNEPDVRAAVKELGLEIPETTHFLPGLHNTTTDEVTLFDTDEAPQSQHVRIESAKSWLEKAGEYARAERAPSLHINESQPHALKANLHLRTRDWAQVRPEWGLSSNAGFIVGPRTLTRSVNLKGRSFLHDYDWHQDKDFGVLESIMTAPMLVTHWINMQYYASTVDNLHYGCGNKVLHNVVGGNIGIFEGNGGDLRSGLAMQSLHDGEKWIHEPVRISVFIAAPREAMDTIIQRHGKVRDLVENEWIYLFQVDDGGSIYRYAKGRWNLFYDRSTADALPIHEPGHFLRP